MYVPGSERLIVRIKRLLDVFSKNQRPVIFTRHIDSEKQGNLMLRWWETPIKESDPMSQITDALDTNLGRIVKKSQYDAFLDTPLEKILRQKSIKQVVICGVLTNCCCETTARSAFMRGFEVYFASDSTATYSKKMHAASCLNLAYGFATLMDVDSIIRTLTTRTQSVITRSPSKLQRRRTTK
jgi:isochorismate hydrolase